MTNNFIYRKSQPTAFTLVELLVVITLMAVLAGMMTYAMAGARQEAREKRAQAEMASMNAILLQKMNEINLQPVLFVPPNETSGPVGPSVTLNEGIEANRVSMLARRDLARMVLPQCRADLIYPPARLQYRKTVRSGGSPGIRACATKIKEPAEWGTMRRIAGFVTPRGATMESLGSLPPVPAVFSDPLIDPIEGANGYFGGSTSSGVLRNALGSMFPVDGSTGTVVIDLISEPWDEDRSADKSTPWTRQYESAECLYLILASTELFGERALDQFSGRMIANLDGDAVPEIIDPWGVPYEFIRDAVGVGFPFHSAVLPAAGSPLAPSPAGRPSPYPPAAPNPAGPDANDYLRTDSRLASDGSTVNDTYRLTPLIISAGPDSDFGIRTSFNLDRSFNNGLAGISPRHSISVVRYTGALLPSPTLSGSYQYPDPYLGVYPTGDPGSASNGGAFAVSPATVTEATQDAWYSGIGLGSRIFAGRQPIAAAGDDIYSAGGAR